MLDPKNEIPLEEAQYSVGQGWASILAKLYQQFEESPNTVRVAQVKEKFGTLRVYVWSYPEDVESFIREAAAESAKTCEWCGAPGQLDDRTGYWLLTLCESCVEERRETRRKMVSSGIVR